LIDGGNSTNNNNSSDNLVDSSQIEAEMIQVMKALFMCMRGMDNQLLALEEFASHIKSRSKLGKDPLVLAMARITLAELILESSLQQQEDFLKASQECEEGLKVLLFYVNNNNTTTTTTTIGELNLHIAMAYKIKSKAMLRCKEIQQAWDYASSSLELFEKCSGQARARIEAAEILVPILLYKIKLLLSVESFPPKDEQVGIINQQQRGELLIKAQELAQHAVTTLERIGDIPNREYANALACLGSVLLENGKDLPKTYQVLVQAQQMAMDLLLAGKWGMDVVPSTLIMMKHPFVAQVTRDIELVQMKLPSTASVLSNQHHHQHQQQQQMNSGVHSSSLHLIDNSKTKIMMDKQLLKAVKEKQLEEEALLLAGVVNSATPVTTSTTTADTTNTNNTANTIKSVEDDNSNKKRTQQQRFLPRGSNFVLFNGLDNHQVRKSLLGEQETGIGLVEDTGEPSNNVIPITTTTATTTTTTTMNIASTLPFDADRYTEDDSSSVQATSPLNKTKGTTNGIQQEQVYSIGMSDFSDIMQPIHQLGSTTSSSGVPNTDIIKTQKSSNKRKFTVYQYVTLCFGCTSTNGGKNNKR
jgi:hypothetical protein